MTLAIELDDRAFRGLLEKAAESGLTPEQLASEIIGRSLRETNQTFKSALAESVRENEELLRRLAK